LVRQALGIPHFGIAKGVLAEPKEKKSVVGAVSRPILSRLPAEMDQRVLLGVPFGDSGDDDSDSDDDDDDEYVPPLMELTTPSAIFYTSSRLATLALEHIPLWKALHRFGPQRQDYAAAFARLSRTAPHPLPQDVMSTGCPVSSNESFIHLIRTSFNYTNISLPATTPNHEYYGILFRSTRHRSAPSKSIRDLYAADRRAHEEAINSGGLLMYWYGIPNAAGENVATCVWTSRDDAVTASRLVRHRAAAALASSVYQNYDVVRYVLKVESGRVAVEAWK
jgi:hypothetical protein